MQATLDSAPDLQRLGEEVIMKMKITKAKPGDALWPDVCRHFPRVIRWLNNPKDGGHYHFFVATNDKNNFQGGCVIDVGPLRFGPLAKQTAGFLEDIMVLKKNRKKGIGTALIRKALDFAWKSNAQHVRWTVNYDNLTGIALYQNLGVAFIPEEDPTAKKPERYYTVVATNPKPMKRK